MANIIECDGCGTRMKFRDGYQPGGGQDTGLSGQADGEAFHWCKDCTEIAKSAVRDTAGTRENGTGQIIT